MMMMMAGSVLVVVAAAVVVDLRMRPPHIRLTASPEFEMAGGAWVQTALVQKSGNYAFVTLLLQLLLLLVVMPRTGGLGVYITSVSALR